MAVQLRPFQAKLKAGICALWAAGVMSVLAVSPTGSGKTVLFSDIINDEPGAVCAIAHRQELVYQISLALARNGIRHRIITGDPLVVRECAAAHMEEFGVSYIDPNSRVAVAGVDTLVNKDKSDPWFSSVRLVVGDEAHHFLEGNKWGRAVAMFPNARMLGVTASPLRADGRGLGTHCGGMFDQMVIGPSMRDLINLGFLTEYRVFVPPSDLDLTDVPVTDSGDYSPTKLKRAVHASHITGDVVTHYLRYAEGKLGVTFAVDVEEASNIAKAFRDAGIPAEVVSSKTPTKLRTQILKRFKKREILQLVNVDLFGEGFDLPAIEVVSMARPTQSYSLFIQQFGRALRLMDGKDVAIIIDHVGNFVRFARMYGPPDQAQDWSLDGRTKDSKPKDGAVLLSVCVNCARPFERIYKACTHCGHKVPVAGRTAPEFVDGDLLELTPEAMAELYEQKAKVDSSFVPMPYGVDPNSPAGKAIKNRHFKNQQVQHGLRETIALWAGWQQSKGYTDSEIYRLFFLTYGTDVMHAQTLASTEAEALNESIKYHLQNNRVVAK